MDLRLYAHTKLNATIKLPASKSISNRALLIAALCDSTAIDGVAQCDDTDAMLAALSQVNEGVVDVGAAGTAMRFLTAYFAVKNPGKTVILRGSERMHSRPIGELVSALRLLGAEITYLENEGFPPLKITAAKLTPRRLTMRGDVSSQFISALMMIAPLIGGLEIELTGDIVSRPYIDMTALLMREMCADVEISGNTVRVGDAPYHWHHLGIEADWTAASYWVALKALMPESSIRLQGLTENRIQGDSMLLQLSKNLGIDCKWDGRDLVLASGYQCACSSFMDMAATPDIAQTFVTALCLMNKPFRITGLRTLRIKETDRIEALRSQLLKLGYKITIEGNDGISWHGEKTEADNQPVINTFNDHRMAMSFAAAAVRFPGIIIADAQVITKSYPDFWHHLAEAGFRIEEIEP
ncbi:MAG: 3-phosphoshikimate 1-carboxyvinyltransferase [Muribaculaceae bacterium]|nr:3-phosphoshikimate 1-carboxyvinyltransferase [Muribaculaceae bacterium]